MTIENWSYEDFVKANNERFSALDFIHAVSTKVALPSDFALCIGRLFAPRLVVFDNVIVAAYWFDEARYQEYRKSGMKPAQAQAWINMVELTNIFHGISLEVARELAASIAELWGERIGKNFPNSGTKVSVLIEDDADEVFVTIGSFSDTP
jgi:hypothetical protein